MRLTVETGPLAGTSIQLDRDHATTLGSAPDCDLRIQEAGVAGAHAVVKALRGEGFGIKALAPGLRVNGAEVEASRLADGDVIEVGTTRIAFGQLQQQGLPVIAGYRVLGVLGKGGMGIVYRAEQTSLHREVALKVLNRDRTQDPAFVARFVAEARAAAKLQHPNVVQVYDVEHDGETYYIAMELMHNGSCETWLKEHGAMPVDRALRVVADAAAGLAYAESLGIVHRDIKPDNLMLDQHGAVKIADLGLASTVEETEDSAIGTPHFMAPEQVLRRDIDHRTDLYALGCTFYRLVTGRTPFRGQSVRDILRAQVKDDPEPPQRVNAAVPAEVAAIIQKLMAKEPSQRFQSAGELLEALDLLLQPPVRRGLWIGLAAAGALVAGGAIWWAVTRPKEREVIEIEKIYDDPEKQQFAERIKHLEREAREHRATIALLQAQVQNRPGEDLAVALDQVVAEHAGTAAAGEAAERAAALRRQLAAESQRRAERQQRIDDHLAALRRALRTPLDGGDFAGALRTLDAPPPADTGGDGALDAGLAALRAEVLQRAGKHLAERRGAIAAARAAGDEPALLAAAEALAADLAAAARWPTELGAELRAAGDDVTGARAALAEWNTARAADSWQRYRALFDRAEGLAGDLARLDFAAAAAAAGKFAAAAPNSPTGDRAAGVAAIAGHAERFAAALASAAATVRMTWPETDSPALHVVRWDRTAGQMFLLESGRRGAKEQARAVADLGLETWLALANQVHDAPAGSRECFLGLLALRAHIAAADGYLARLDRGNDAAGTGAMAYPLGVTLFDTLLRRVPDDGEPWVAALRHELTAGRRLAAGLRALSERRNVAAAAHLDKLFADYPHSVVVAALP